MNCKVILALAAPALMGLVPSCVAESPSGPVEHIVWDGDTTEVDVSPPDWMSVRGATPESCADMGGTWNPERQLDGPTPEGVCERVDF